MRPPTKVVEALTVISQHQLSRSKNLTKNEGVELNYEIDQCLYRDELREMHEHLTTDQVVYTNTLHIELNGFHLLS